ncbi:hypothetical protein ACFX2J_032239 [Malus domestica]
MFQDEGRVWIELKYEGLPNYCLYCGKLGPVDRASPDGTPRESVRREDFKDIASSLMKTKRSLVSQMEPDGGLANKVKRQREVEGEAKRAREAAFDAKLIGRGGEVVPGVDNMKLLNHQEPYGIEIADVGRNQRGIDVDLNELVLGDDSMNLKEEHRHTGFIGNQQQEIRSEVVVKGTGLRGTQNPGPFNLGRLLQLLPMNKVERKERMRTWMRGQKRKTEMRKECRI